MPSLEEIRPRLDFWRIFENVEKIGKKSPTWKFHISAKIKVFSIIFIITNSSDPQLSKMWSLEKIRFKWSLEKFKFKNGQKFLGRVPPPLNDMMYYVFWYKIIIEILSQICWVMNENNKTHLLSFKSWKKDERVVRKYLKILNA